MPRKLKPPPKKHERGWHQGSVQEVRPGVWRAWQDRATSSDGTTRRPTGTFKGPDAEARAKRWAAGDPEPAVMYLGAWLERWLALRWPRLRVRTREAYESHIAACGTLLLRPIASITTEEWQILTNVLLERWSLLHVRNWKSIIKAAHQAAVPRHLDANPLAGVMLPKATDRPIRAFREDELVALLRAAAGKRHELWVHLSLSTGLRLSEVRGLTWDKVDLAERVITIDEAVDQVSSVVGPTKTGRHREVDIPEELVPRLAEQRARQRPPERYVIGHAKNGGPIGASVLREWIVNLCKRLGIRPLGPHALRHTFATRSLDAGVPLKEVSETLGHANVGVTSQVYSHAIRRRRRQAADVMGRVIAEALSGPIREIGSEDCTRETG